MKKSNLSKIKLFFGVILSFLISASFVLAYDSGNRQTEGDVYEWYGSDCSLSWVSLIDKNCCNIAGGSNLWCEVDDAGTNQEWFKIQTPYLEENMLCRLRLRLGYSPDSSNEDNEDMRIDVLDSGDSYYLADPGHDIKEVSTDKLLFMAGQNIIKFSAITDQSVWIDWYRIYDCTPVECIPGEIQAQNCGNCGSRIRVCQLNYQWGPWSGCTGQGVCSPGSTTECGNCGIKTCQNDCQWSPCRGEGCTPGSVDSRSCGSGECLGRQERVCSSSCEWNSWSDCSSVGYDCGTCALCDINGECTVYDDTQDNDCYDTICPDNCNLIPDNNPFTWDYADDVPNECISIFTCSNNPCDYSHECSVANCGAECEDDSDCPRGYCSRDCECIITEPECGNGIIETGEECEPPNTVLASCDQYGEDYLQDYCDSNCQLQDDECEDDYPGCTSDPECDELNPGTNDCSLTCQYEPGPECGDGDVDLGEECDDGNNIDGDSCSADCELEIPECEPFEIDIGECGNCGVKFRICEQDYTWGVWSDCFSEGICSPGEEQNQSCGLTDVGECEYGTQTRICSNGCYWDIWGDCIGAIYPTDEICDGLDNDCDGEVDEDVCADCGNGIIEAGEECEPPNTVLASCDQYGADYLQDYCDSNCQLQDDECEDDYPGCTSDPECDELNPGTGDCSLSCEFVGCIPEPEVCDGLDNDCDGEIDEGLTQSCGSGDCEGTQVCVEGSWSECSSVGNDCGICALCDVDGECNVYDETQDQDCNDNLYCNGVETCQSLFTCQSTGPVDCGYLNNDCNVGTCDEGIDDCVSVPDGGLCDDDNVCTNDYCDSQTGCYHTNNNNPCDDGLWCNGLDQCQGGSCANLGPSVNCDDADVCTDDSCNEVTDTCEHVFNTNPCDDGLFCTIDDVCTGGVCDGEARVCDDGIDCTTDDCDEVANSCLTVPDDVPCDDTNDCTDDSCTVGVGCTYVNNNDDCGTCAVCAGGSCTYDDTQDYDCLDTLCPDGCDLNPDGIGYTWDYCDDVPNECIAIDTCSNNPCDYLHECSLSCGAECVDVQDCPPKCTITSHKLYVNVECDACECDYSTLRCVIGECGAECEDDNDCACPVDDCDGFTLLDYPDYGVCGTAGSEGCLCQVDTGSGGDCEPILIPFDPECYTPECGNEILDDEEECDDGNLDDDDRCSSDCEWTYCGDDIVQDPNGDGESEECDDGNSVSNDGCENDCTLTPTCDSDARVKILFDKTHNYNFPSIDGKTFARTYVGPDKDIYGNEVYIDLVDGTNRFILDSGLVEDVHGLALERGLGWIRIVLHGSNPLASMIELVDAFVIFENAYITDFVNDVANGNPLENQGNAIYSPFTNPNPSEDEVFANIGTNKADAYMRVNVADDGFILYYECVELCGNGILDEGEECDDGNSIDDDDCSNDCEIVYECNDKKDNDCDGLIDYPDDPFCLSPEDDQELGNTECDDCIDNDEDGLIDFNDPGCKVTRFDDSEYNDETYGCSDGLDNDGDGLIDRDDPGCYSSGRYSPRDNAEGDRYAECRDYFDNDSDGLVDLDDPDCVDRYDDNESE